MIGGWGIFGGKGLRSGGKRVHKKCNSFSWNSRCPMSRYGKVGRERERARRNATRPPPLPQRWIHSISACLLYSPECPASPSPFKWVGPVGSLSLSLTHTHTGKGRDGQSRSPKRVFILPPPSSSSSFAFGVCRSQSSYVQLQSMFLFLSPPSSLRLQRLESLLQRSSHALFLCSCDMKRGRERRRHKKGRRRQEKGLRKNTTQVYLVVYRLILYTYV